MVLDVEKSLEVIKNFSKNLDLVDAWRILNPDSSRYTWRQKKPEIHCRLDFFLISHDTLCNIIEADILPGYKTDHSMITIQISLHSNVRGRGFWKLIGEILIKALNYSHVSGKLTISQRRGIIKLIQKKDADLTSIKSWRPLTLLNCDYKRLLQIE